VSWRAKIRQLGRELAQALGTKGVSPATPEGEEIVDAVLSKHFSHYDWATDTDVGEVVLIVAYDLHPDIDWLLVVKVDTTTGRATYRLLKPWALPPK